MEFKSYIQKIADGTTLTFEEASQAFNLMMSGEATPSQIGGFLMALRVRGETVNEIMGAVTTMRQKMLPVNAPKDAIDIVGTGGDASGSYNVSTCAAFVAAGAGIPIAKHGNRALSSKSGSADALIALGINVDINPYAIEKCIKEAGLGFMFAPMHHSAMRHVGPSRVELGTRTIFNFLGPLSNPASVKSQLIGVFSPEWVEPIAESLQKLGSENLWVVHGDGMDEITVTAETQVCELRDGKLNSFTITPEDAGVSRHDFAALKGGLAEENAIALKKVLEGEKNAYRDIVVMNAGAAIYIANKADNYFDGCRMAEQSIDDGKALKVLEGVVKISNDTATKEAAK